MCQCQVKTQGPSVHYLARSPMCLPFKDIDVI